MSGRAVTEGTVEAQARDSRLLVANCSIGLGITGLLGRVDACYSKFTFGISAKAV